MSDFDREGGCVSQLLLLQKLLEAINLERLIVSYKFQVWCFQFVMGQLLGFGSVMRMHFMEGVHGSQYCSHTMAREGDGRRKPGHHSPSPNNLPLGPFLLETLP